MGIFDMSEGKEAKKSLKMLDGMVGELLSFMAAKVIHSMHPTRFGAEGNVECGRIVNSFKCLLAMMNMMGRSGQIDELKTKYYTQLSAEMIDSLNADMAKNETLYNKALDKVANNMEVLHKEVRGAGGRVENDELDNGDIKKLLRRMLDEID